MWDFQIISIFSFFLLFNFFVLYVHSRVCDFTTVHVYIPTNPMHNVSNIILFLLGWQGFYTWCRFLTFFKLVILSILYVNCTSLLSYEIILPNVFPKYEAVEKYYDTKIVSYIFKIKIASWKYYKVIMKINKVIFPYRTYTLECWQWLSFVIDFK